MALREYEIRCSMFLEAFRVAQFVCSKKRERIFVWNMMSIRLDAALFKEYIQEMLPGIQIEEISGPETYLSYFKFTFKDRPKYVQTPGPQLTSEIARAQIEARFPST